MAYSKSVFEDAMGQRVEQENPVTPGTCTTPAQGRPILFGWVQPVQFTMEQVNSDYLRRNHLSWLPLYRKAALKPSTREPHVLHEHL